MHAPDRLAQEVEGCVEVTLAVLDLPRQHGLPGLQEAGVFFRHDGVFTSDVRGFSTTSKRYCASGGKSQ